METVKSVDDKQSLLKIRREEERKLGQTIDRLMAEAAEPTRGCWSWVWRRLGRGQKRAMVNVASSEAGGSESAQSGKVGQAIQAARGASSTQARLFGMKKSSPDEKLAQAAATLKSRLLQMESKAASEREEAKSALKMGQKSSALRLLKRAKMSDKQVEAAQQSLLAIEQQVDLMAQAAMQKEIASALATSSKGMKANKKMVKNAEAAVDDAQEARDMAEDLSNALSELGANDNGDDDELLQELQAMVDEDPPNIDNVEISLSDDAEDAKQAEIVKVEARAADWEEAERLRQFMPAVPKKNGKSAKFEEKQGLLTAQ